MSEIGKAVRDRCNEQDIPVSRRDVNFVLHGILHAGHQLGEDADPAKLADKFCSSVASSCEEAQFALDDDQKKLLALWLWMPPSS